MRQAKSFDLATKKVEAISAEGRVVMRPMALKGGVMTTVDDKVVSTAQKETTVRTSGTQLFISRNGVEKAYTPIEGSVGYIWASLSPDGTETNLEALRSGLNGNTTDVIHEVEGVNHIFQHCKTGSVAEYKEIEETISPEVLSAIITWISNLK